MEEAIRFAWLDCEAEVVELELCVVCIDAEKGVIWEPRTPGMVVAVAACADSFEALQSVSQTLNPT